MRTELDEKIRIAITQGDINGIGYEVIIKTLLEPEIYEICTPIVYGSPKIAAYHRKALNINNFSFHHIKDISETAAKKPNIINCTDDNARVELGKSTPTSGEAALRALDAAINDIKVNKLEILVTAPLNKSNIQVPNSKFSGHTEYLANQFGVKNALMLMISEKLKLGLVTTHVPLSKVSELIKVETILEKLRILNQSLMIDFGIRKPHIAVLSLNPHSGDDGLLGSEEREIIIPALNKAKDEGIVAIGPYAADGFFGAVNFLKFDAVLAMYHDQGLIPFKQFTFDEGINFTAGLPIVRTSPAHGTAYEIAGMNKASEKSFRQAIYWAVDIYDNRTKYNQLIANQLPADSITAAIVATESDY